MLHVFPLGNSRLAMMKPLCCGIYHVTRHPISKQFVVVFLMQEIMRLFIALILPFSLPS